MSTTQADYVEPAQSKGMHGRLGNLEPASRARGSDRGHFLPSYRKANTSKYHTTNVILCSMILCSTDFSLDSFKPLFLNMTRVTNFGRKRAYLEAGFGQPEDEKIPLSPDDQDVDDPDPSSQKPANDEPPKKKRKVKKKNPAQNIPSVEGDEVEAAKGDEDTVVAETNATANLTKKALKKKKWKDIEKDKKQRREPELSFSYQRCLIQIPPRNLQDC